MLNLSSAKWDVTSRAAVEESVGWKPLEHLPVLCSCYWGRGSTMLQPPLVIGRISFYAAATGGVVGTVLQQSLVTGRRGNHFYGRPCFPGSQEGKLPNQQWVHPGQCLVKIKSTVPSPCGVLWTTSSLGAQGLTFKSGKLICFCQCHGLWKILRGGCLNHWKLPCELMGCEGGRWELTVMEVGWSNMMGCIGEPNRQSQKWVCTATSHEQQKDSYREQQLKETVKQLECQQEGHMCGTTLQGWKQ